MMSGAMSGILLAFGMAPAGAKIEQYRSGGWDLSIRHDHFSGQTRCLLVSVDHRMRFQPGAVGFRLGKRRDTLSAWYRIDDGAPVRWQDRTAALVGAGVAIDGPGLDNPTGGWVWIPISEAEDAKVVAIRSKERARVRRFHLGDFAPMLAAAHRLGCGSDDAFRI